METLHLPWIVLAIALCAFGAIWVRRLRDSEATRGQTLVVCAGALLCTVAAWIDFAMTPGGEPGEASKVFASLTGQSLFAVDALSAPLAPLAALVYLLMALATRGTKVRKFSFDWLLISEAILLATLACRERWVIIGLLAMGTIPPFVDLRAHRRSTRVFVLHMASFVALMVVGQVMVDANAGGQMAMAGVACLMAAVLIRSGVVPVHCWMTDLFEHASFGAALLFVTPMVGAYAAVRLVLPIAPDWALHGIAILSLVTAIYAAGMALVQRDARRFFCYLFLSHKSLVLVGLETVTPIGLTGGLCVWMSASLSLAGFGLTLRSIEARTGRLSLDTFHGLFEHIPGLAALFLVTGLASIGFPGSAGFVAAELLVDGAVQVSPLVGIAIVIASALNGLAVLHAYFRVFTGTPHVASIDLCIRLPERIAVLVLTALILGGGLYPQPNVASRYRVANELVEQREKRFQSAAAERASEFTLLERLRALSPNWH